MLRYMLSEFQMEASWQASKTGSVAAPVRQEVMMQLLFAIPVQGAVPA